LALLFVFEQTDGVNKWIQLVEKYQDVKRSVNDLSAISDSATALQLLHLMKVASTGLANSANWRLCWDKWEIAFERPPTAGWLENTATTSRQKGFRQ
jgi:hypothetical protein